MAEHVYSPKAPHQLFGRPFQAFVPSSAFPGKIMLFPEPLRNVGEGVDVNDKDLTPNLGQIIRDAVSTVSFLRNSGLISEPPILYVDCVQEMVSKGELGFYDDGGPRLYALDCVNLVIQHCLYTSLKFNDDISSQMALTDQKYHIFDMFLLGELYHICGAYFDQTGKRAAPAYCAFDGPTLIAHQRAALKLYPFECTVRHISCGCMKSDLDH